MQTPTEEKSSGCLKCWDTPAGRITKKEPPSSRASEITKIQVQLRREDKEWTEEEKQRAWRKY